KVLHLAIDYLIGNISDKQARRLSHKYGFHHPDDFLLVTKTLSMYYRNLGLNTSSGKNLAQFSVVNSEMSKLVPTVLGARQAEVTKHLQQCEYFKTNMIIESFAWDTRQILGDNSSCGNVRQITTVNLSYRHLNLRNRVFWEMNKKMVNDFICFLQKTLSQ
ncbi:hypothetical protein KR009_010054, partial [Drosophila setifemur]